MINYFSRHPTAANLLMLFLMILGFFALPKLQRETFPDFESKLIDISIAYPGASSDDVEQSVCQRVEDALDKVNDIAEIKCIAKENIATTRVELKEGGNIRRLMEDVKSEIDAIDNFPDNVETAIIKELGRTAKVASIAITGPMHASDLKLYAEQVKKRLQRMSNIREVNVLGFSEHQLGIAISQENLQKYQLSLNDISQVIGQQSIDLPAGNLKTNEQDLLIRFMDLRRDIKQLEDLFIISSVSGAEVRLGDIATIRDQFELDEEKIIFNGERAAILDVIKTKQQDSLKVMATIESFVANEQAMASPGVHFNITDDRSSVVKDRLQLLFKNGWQGLLLVFLIMWLFFPGRFAFWVAMGLPVSFLGALFMMQMLGLTINMITMVALLIAIGLLMDDAIVIAENIASHLKQGKSGLQAAIDGTRQVSPGVLSSFLTTISVFTPLAFLSGNMGQVLQFVPMVLILVLAVSLIEAFLILPNHLGHALAHSNYQQNESGWRVHFEAKVMAFRDKVLGPLINFAISHSLIFLSLVIAVFIISLAMPIGGKLKFQAFPDIEGDVIEARLLLAPGTPLHRTEGIISQIEQALEQVKKHYDPLQKDGQKLIKNTTIRYNFNLDANEAGPHLATFSVDLLTAEKRQGTISDIIALWRETLGDIPEVLSLSFKEPVIGPGGLDLEIRLFGSELEELKLASLELQDWLRAYQGVIDIQDNLRPGKTELRLSLRPGSLSMGVDAATIAQQLRSAFYGSTAQEIQLGSENYEIDVQLSSNDMASYDDLTHFRIQTKAGDLIPLINLVDIKTGRGFSRIERIDGQRSVTISGDIDTRIANAREIINHTKDNFLDQLKEKYPGIQTSIEGQNKETSKTAGSMLQGFGLGLLGIFILLSFQFKSYIEPLVVMAIIPLALIGVIWGHILMGLSLTMPSIIGFASLAGIVVNDSILLVEFLKQKQRQGENIDQAAINASLARFRAVLITSVTTIAGLIPLLLEKSMQAQILVPLVTSLAFGLLATTFLVLLVVPALFHVLKSRTS